jgi:predicted LPLAT superfamily acyltransferase
MRGTVVTPPHEPPREHSGWAGIAERGSLGALRVIRWIYRTLGRRFTIAALKPIVAYFFLTGRQTRTASLDYLRTLWAAPGGREALGERPTWRHAYRHIHEFAEQVVDRMIVWSGDVDAIEVDYRGTELLRELARAGQGAILLGSHVGSYDLLRSVAERTGVTLNILMFTPRTARINAFFEQMHPDLKLRLISVQPGSLSAAFEMKAAIDRGEFVGVMGDRVWGSEGDRTVSVTFLGRPARFPLGPFLLQATLGCPMVLTGCFRTGPGRYRAAAVPFAPAGVAPRGERRKYAEEQAQRYAHALEQWCLHTPYQWFNFFAFWPEADS